MPAALKRFLLQSAESIACRYACYQTKAFLPLRSSVFRKPLIQVVSRYGYRERVESFPVKSSSELLKILHNKYGKDYYFYIGPFSHNKRLVRLIQLLPGYHEQRGRGFVLPETVVLAAIAAPGFYAIDTPEGPLYFYHRTTDEPYATAAAVKGGVVNDVATARVVLGVPESQPCVHWQQNQYLGFLQHNLWQTPMQAWLVGRPGKQVTALSQQPWKAMLALAAGVLLTYGVLSGVYLQRTLQQRTAQLELLQPAVADYLQLRASAEQEAARIQALDALGHPPQAFISGWDIVATVRQQGFDVQHMQGNATELDLRGEVDSATAMMVIINQHPAVQAAEFTAPIRRGRSGEVYAIRIQLKPLDVILPDTALRN